MAQVDQMLFNWISVGDAKVCEDCLAFEAYPAAPLEWWEENGIMPRQVITKCEPHCRCGLAPAGMDDIQRQVEDMIEKAVQEGFGHTVIDLTTGRTVLLREFEQYEGLLTVQYERIAYMESLIYQWKLENGGIKLPDDFFQQQDIEKMIRWLEGKGVLPGQQQGGLLTKNQIENKLYELGIKDYDLSFIDDIEVLQDILDQITLLLKEEGYAGKLTTINIFSNGAYARGGSGKILLNYDKFNDKKALIETLKEDIRTRFHPNIPENQMIKSLITHEYAHVLTREELSLGQGLSYDLKQLRKGYIKELENLQSEYNKKLRNAGSGEKQQEIKIWFKKARDIYISKYADENIYEFVAEGFMDYKHNPNPSPYSEKIGKLIDAKYKKGGM